jgi:hypothetical protein
MMSQRFSLRSRSRARRGPYSKWKSVSASRGSPATGQIRQPAVRLSRFDERGQRRRPRRSTGEAAIDTLARIGLLG